MGNNTQSRKWSLVINNPQECGLDHSTIVEILRKFSPAYFCMADEIATTGTYHTHIFLYSPSPIRFSTVKNRFPTAHIDKTYGSAKENRDYILKEGKWAETDKAETKVPDTFLEWGDMPAEKEEKAPQMYKLIQEVRDGISTANIIEASPNLAFRVHDIDTLRQTLLSDRYAWKTARLRCGISSVQAARARREVSMNATMQRTFAASPTTATDGAFLLTVTPDRMCWYSRNFIRRYLLRIC